METLEFRTRIEETFEEVRSFSFREKKEQSVDGFLDAILDVKRRLKEKSDKIIDISERMEGITWFSGLDNDNLIRINDLISSAKDAHSTLIRQYVSLNHFKAKGIAKKEIKNFKYSIDTLKEAYEDLESVFFFLPEVPDFVETTKKLSLI